jgi:transcriptional regulator with XRE-family HTH domain
MIADPAAPTRLRLERHRRGWTLDDAASRIGCSAPWFSRIETGTFVPSIELCLAIERVFGSPIDALLRRPDES